MREASAEELGFDAITQMETRKIAAIKKLRKAVTYCFVLGLSRGETQTAMRRAFEQSVSERHEKLRAKFGDEQAAEETVKL